MASSSRSGTNSRLEARSSRSISRLACGAAVKAQQNADGAILSLPPVGLGTKDGEVSQIFKNCFQQICLSGRPVQQVLDAQARQLNTILDEVKVACWKPDPAGTPCKVQ